MAEKSKQADAFENAPPGVGIAKDKRLDALADKFTDQITERSELSEAITKTEKDILERMQETGIKVYKYADRVVTIKDGKAHVKVKTAKADTGK